MTSALKGNRIIACTVATVCALVLITLLNILPLPENLVRLLVDKYNGNVNYVAVQNFMWIAFFVGLAELSVRYLYIREEEKELGMGLLSESSNELISISQTGVLKERIEGRNGQLSGIIRRLVDNFTANQSTDRCSTHLSAEVELISNDIDRAYASLRYIVWLLPTLGFVGTVWGIMLALGNASANKASENLLNIVMDSMGVAFCTTLLALILSCILVFFMQLIQTREEAYLNKCFRYCLTYFINNLYDKN